MSRRILSIHGVFYSSFIVVAVIGLVFSVVTLGQAQDVTVNNNTTNNTTTGTNNGTGFPIVNAVGGVAIDPQGILGNVQTDMLGQLAKLRAQALQKAPAGINEFNDLRKISLRRLEAAIEQSNKTGKPLPDDIRFLAGLQQIRYVFVYPEQKDIILAGPGEGWKIDDRGNVVGITTGRPVMLLDDLLIALRTAQAAAQSGISCSIDPTSEGLGNLKQFVSQLKNIGNPQTTISGIEQVLGMQQISVTGIPATSHFAQVLVAADYRMKRLAMNFDLPPTGVKLPSFLQMISANGRGMNNMLPRWWLEPRYEPLLRDADALAWELRGASVKALTEEDFLTSAGTKEHTGKASMAAQKWADNMTNQFAALSLAEPIFAELQNCMELAIVGALIVKENLADKAGYSMPVLMNSQELRPAEFNAPKQVASQASVLKKGNNWIISASGGVAINSWGIADKTQKSNALAPVRTKAAPSDDSKWWWN
jgi:hypothetical protein